MNVFTVLDQAAARYGRRGAVFLGTEQCHTWSELRERALRLAGSLRHTLPAGSRIAVASENCPEIVELMFAAWAAECVIVPINYKLHVREMHQILDDAGVSQVFASPRIAAELAGTTAVPVEVIDSDDYRRRMASTSVESPRRTDPASLAWLFYTSGTTGRSKGAMLSHRNLMAMTVSHLADFDDPDSDCSLIHGAPMSHGSGLYIAPYVLRGARQVIPNPSPSSPTSFSTCVSSTPAAVAFSPRRWSAV